MSAFCIDNQLLNRLEREKLVSKLDKESLELLTADSDSYIRYISKRIKDHNLAEDYFHDALLKAVISEDGPRDQEKLRAWFYRILRNVIIDSYRKEASQQKGIESILSEAELSLMEKSVDGICCDLEGFFLKLIKPEDEAIIRALNLEGVSLSDYAKKHNISEATLRVRKHRAMQALRKKVLKVCSCFKDSNLDKPNSDECGCQAQG